MAPYPFDFDICPGYEFGNIWASQQTCRHRQYFVPKYTIIMPVVHHAVHLSRVTNIHRWPQAVNRHRFALG
jgi:hypothetical protein